MSEQLSADELRGLMGVVRHRMSGEAANVASSAKRLTDWRFYMHEFTGPVLAAASVVGFLLVPKKQKPLADFDQLQKVAEKKGWIVDPSTVAGKPKPTLLESGLSLAGNMALRAGLAYASSQAGRFFGRTAADQPTGEPHHDRR